MKLNQSLTPEMMQHAGAELFQDILSADKKGVFASNGPNFYGAVFGRDSVEVAEDVILLDKTLAQNIIITLASLQGVKTDNHTEEEPGKIHHEHRVFKGFEELEDTKRQELHGIYNYLNSKWGYEGDDTMTYYGSVDATPLYVRLIGKYIDAHGDSILHQEYTDRNGDKQTIRRSVEEATLWMIDRIAKSKVGMIEYKTTNPDGIVNQVWKDSETSYVHENGEIANFESGIAACEVQAYAYDALLTAAGIVGEGDNPETFLQAALDLEKNVFRHLWLEDRGYFAMAVDYDQDGNPRPIKTLSSNTGLMLDSMILRRQKQPEEIARRIADIIMSEDFLTPVGVRCRSLKHKDLIDFPDYHGSYAVWPKETSDVARGLVSSGFVDEGKQLMRTIIKATEDSGNFYEFYFVDEDGNLIDNTNETELASIYSGNGEHHINTPEPGQAWSISAYLQARAILND